MQLVVWTTSVPHLMVWTKSRLSHTRWFGPRFVRPTPAGVDRVFPFSLRCFGHPYLSIKTVFFVYPFLVSTGSPNGGRRSSFQPKLLTGPLTSAQTSDGRQRTTAVTLVTYVVPRSDTTASGTTNDGSPTLIFHRLSPFHC